MYKHTLKAADQYFARALALPKNAEITAPEALRVGTHLGSLAVTATAHEAVTLAATKSLTLHVLESDTRDGQFTPRAPSYTLSAGTEPCQNAPGETLLTVVLPDCKPWAKIRLTTNDDTASGSVDLFVSYLAR